MVRAGAWRESLDERERAKLEPEEERWRVDNLHPGTLLMSVQVRCDADARRLCEPAAVAWPVLAEYSAAEPDEGLPSRACA